MALKGGRKIVVRVRAFRWNYFGKNDRWGGSALIPLVAIQEDTERPGVPMVAYLKSRRFISEDAHDLDLGGVVHKASVTPQDTRSLIEHALDDGWDPSGKGRYVSPEGIDLGDYSTRDPK